jgi:glycosyltransferase involved in cell wall biosynthesis
MFSFISFMISSFFIGITVQDVDLIWGTTPPLFQGITAWVLARLKRSVFLLEVRDLWPLFAIAVGVLQNPILIRLSEWLEKFLYRRADCVVINSPGYEAHVLERGAKVIHLVANGVDTTKFDPAEEGRTFKRAHNLKGKFVVLYAGAHGLSNDLGTILKAANSLREHKEIQFVLMGDGKEKDRLIAKAKSLDLDNVHFLPSVPKEEMPEHLAAADACVAILKPVEAFKTTYPNKVFDYLAAGRPIILAIDGVIREVVEDAEAGIFVKPGNPDVLAKAILQLERERDLGRRMGLAGRCYVEEHFNRSDHAAKLLEIMQRQVEGKGS